MNYHRVLERLLNTPLLAHPDKAETIAGVVLRRAGVEVTAVAAAEIVNKPRPAGGLRRAGPLQEAAERGEDTGSSRKPFLFGVGVAVIEVTGSLAHRQGFIGESSGVMGYDGIAAQLDAALADREVKGIILDIHSPGGEVFGCFQLADRIHAARGVKPVVAIADEMAFSAGYAIAAAASELWLASDTAEAGSVGACMVHFSFEKWLKGEGIKPTIFQSGKRKTDGHPFADLPADVADRFQAQIDTLGGVFEDRVAKWRGMTSRAVKATEADRFLAKDAVDIGFADGIASPVEVFAALAATVGQSIGNPAPGAFSLR